MSRPRRWRNWLGVGERRWKKAPDEEVQPGKTLWDWLQLLIVPAILIGVTFAWSATQTSSDNKREDRRIAADRAAAEEARQDATLQGYLNQMSGLMLHEKLLTSKQSDAVRAVARTVTLATLRRLNGDRKAEVVRFLHEARLLDIRTPRVYLSGADLVGADLVGADLDGANLEQADLERAELRHASLVNALLDAAQLGGADLRDAILGDANLVLADMRGVNLEGAYLARASLGGANLGGANLGRAYLKGADLDNTNLERANLGRADLGGADLEGANLEGANLERANLEHANLGRADLEEDGAPEFGVANLVGANLEGAKKLDLDRFISDLAPKQRKAFLDSQKGFLDSLSPEELAKFNLTPEKLAKFRREANRRLTTGGSTA